MDKEFLMGFEDVTQEVAEAVLAEHGKIVEAYEGRMKAMAVEHAVAMAIVSAGGRNRKAITALLDTEALAGEENVDAAAQKAVDRVKQECGYLFSGAPAFAPDTGTDSAAAEEPMSLAEALKEKFCGK